MDPANAANELIYIQTSALTLTIKGPASHPSFPGTEFNTKDASVRVECEDSFEIDMAADYEMQAMQNLGRARVARYGLRPLFFEQQRYELVSKRQIIRCPI